MELPIAGVLRRDARNWVSASADISPGKSGVAYRVGPLSKGVRRVRDEREEDALGLGSVNSDERDRMTLNKERAGDQLC